MYVLVAFRHKIKQDTAFMKQYASSHSVPMVLENGKTELSEQWEWTSGDYSKGVSLLIEV